MMNLKEAFRYQNKLQGLLDECRNILSNDRNTTKTQSTYLRKKVMEGAENEEVVEAAPSEYADRINDIVEMMMYLLALPLSMTLRPSWTSTSMQRPASTTTVITSPPSFAIWLIFAALK